MSFDKVLSDHVRSIEITWYLRPGSGRGRRDWAFWSLSCSLESSVMQRAWTWAFLTIIMRILRVQFTSAKSSSVAIGNLYDISIYVHCIYLCCTSASSPIPFDPASSPCGLMGSRTGTQYHPLIVGQQFFFCLADIDSRMVLLADVGDGCSAALAANATSCDIMSLAFWLFHTFHTLSDSSCLDLFGRFCWSRCPVQSGFVAQIWGWPCDIVWHLSALFFPRSGGPNAATNQPPAPAICLAVVVHWPWWLGKLRIKDYQGLRIQGCQT